MKLLSILAGLVSTCALSAALMPCPDCGQSVSARALMCPQCGCPGEAIVASAAASKADASLQRLSRSVVKVRGGLSPGAGVVISQDDSIWILTSLDLMTGESLEVFAPSRTSPLPYNYIQLEAHSPLVRLNVQSTNLLALDIGSKSSKGACLSAQSPSNKVHLAEVCISDDGTITGLRKDVSIPVGAALLDSATNVIGLVIHKGGKPLAMMLREPPVWVDMQPREFRNQLMALSEAEKASPDSSANLRSIKWGTAYLEEKANALIARLENKSEISQ